MKKIAVVTGGGSGIGQSAALELQKSGFNVLGMYGYQIED